MCKGKQEPNNRSEAESVWEQLERDLRSLKLLQQMQSELVRQMEGRFRQLKPTPPTPE